MSLKNLIEMISFSILVVICILFSQYALMNKISVEKYDPFLKNYKKTNYDVIFMGSSHIYNTVMPQELWKKYKITSYNCGSGCCTLPVDYYVLRQICNYTKPKVVFIDLFELIEFDNLENGNGKYRPDILDQYRVQFDEFPISKLKVEAVNDIFDNRDSNLDFLFKLAIYHNNWKNLGNTELQARNIPQNGAAFLLGTQSVQYEEFSSGEKIEIASIASEYLPKIYDYCLENDIKLVFTYVPFVADEENASVAYSFDEVLKKYPKASYINLLNTGKINYATDLYVDGSHLNYIGAVKVTNMLGEYIKKNYPELIHTDSETIDFWNEKYNDYFEYKISRFEQNKLIENLELVYGDDFCAELLYNSSNEESFKNNVDLQNLITELGNNIEVKSLNFEQLNLNNDNEDVVLKVYSKQDNKLVFETK